MPKNLQEAARVLGLVGEFWTPDGAGADNCSESDASGSPKASPRARSPRAPARAAVTTVRKGCKTLEEGLAKAEEHVGAGAGPGAVDSWTVEPSAENAADASVHFSCGLG